MTVGRVGGGSRGGALARGWGEPILCTDGGSGRAAALVAEVGGEALASNAELVERADLVVLCHKPAQLEAVAAEVGDRALAVVSVLRGAAGGPRGRGHPGAPLRRAHPQTRRPRPAGRTRLFPVPRR